MTGSNNKKRCNRCGQYNPSGANYCYSCGFQLNTYPGLGLCTFNRYLKSEMFSSERIGKIAEQLTSEMDLDSKDRLLKSLSPEFKDMVVMEVEKFLIFGITKTYGTFAGIIADEIKRYKEVEEGKRPPQLKELMNLLNAALK